jgi:hypothetical protein
MSRIKDEHFFQDVIDKLEEIEIVFEEAGFANLNDEYDEEEANDDENLIPELTLVKLRDLILEAKELAQDCL